MTGIYKISTEFSEKLQLELKSISIAIESSEDRINVSTAYEYLAKGSSQAPYEYKNILQFFPKNAKILDIGVGLGESSVFLALNNFDVYALEPSESCCKIIKSVSDKFNLNINVVQGVAEDVGKLNTKFDVIIFNASLHHCDDPYLALKVSKKILVKGGKLLLVNENFLRPWISEQKYQKLLISNPVEMGHYGGNEHAYSNGKYQKLVIKTFGNCKKLIPRRRSSLDELELKISSRINGQRVITTNFGIFSRHLYYLIKEKIVSFSGLYLLAAKLSLVPVHFMAVNNCEKYRD
jgi:2-polyprenyl-3-methyl-5-hydroxy-6-metoxy-1,4-benzoquinol methylase